MKLWPLFSLLLLLVQQPILRGQAVDAFRAAEWKGDAALADGLWEVAEMHFRQCLADPSLTSDLKSQVAIRLAESLIRAGNPKEALELLGQSFVAKNPATPFWKAQALAAQDRFSEALGIFRILLADPATPHRTEAGFTQASLQLVLGQADAALETLAQLIPNSDAATGVKIQLYQVEILLDLKSTSEARQAMPGEAAIATADRPLAAFLNAQLLLNEGQSAAAEISFQELVNHPQGQSLTRYHSAAVGLADAIQAQGNPDEAANSLLAFLQDHPASPVLEAIFKRILQWLPDKPTLTDPILENLAQWIPSPALRDVLPLDTTQPNVIAAWPIYPAVGTLTELSAYSLYTRAIGLHRSGTPEARAESRVMLNRLRMDYPQHSLANRALYQSARWFLEDGNTDQAFSILNTLRDTTKIPILRGEAAFLQARIDCLNGNSQKAIQLFDEAATALAAPEARLAKLQSAIARLRSGDLKGVTLILQSGAAPDPSLEADLELERALSTTPPVAARAAIEDFLSRFPAGSSGSGARQSQSRPSVRP